MMPQKFLNARTLLMALLAFLLFGLQVANALAAPDATTRVSVDSSGIQGNGRSSTPSISADGRYVAFHSFASNLVSGDTNGAEDVFVHDRATGTTTRVSVDSAGIQGDNDSNSPSISADGRYVAFQSIAANLVSGDTNGVFDIFVHDRTTGAITRISVSSLGTQGNNDSVTSSISSDGRYVAFRSIASDLVSGDTNGQDDIFVHDRMIGTTTRVSVDSSGLQGNAASIFPSISGDGRYVAFDSAASNLTNADTNGQDDIFVHDRTLGTTTRISVDSFGLQGDSGSSDPSISADGRYVAFTSTATNLVNGDSNGVWDVFVYDRTMGVTTRISVGSSGTQGNSISFISSISANGRYVVFDSFASNLVSGDTNGDYDIFVRDLMLGTITRVSVNSSGLQGDNDSFNPSISADGRLVTFDSFANNLISVDTNGVTDIFVHEQGVTTLSATPTTSAASILPATGFTPGIITLLPVQPAEKAYASTDLTLEIPAINVKATIVGVPQDQNGWDVSWLGNNAGWLNGSAFPTWNGNSVLTGHVWNADNTPGVFASLKTLQSGDKILIHAFGQVYTYEVRESQRVSSSNVQTVMQHEKLAWLTLVTCEDYRILWNSYSDRRMVRAVLVSVK